MSDERETIQRNPESVAAWKCECAFLHEQVEKLTDECVVLRASSRSKLETISSLELQVEKLTKERDELKTVPMKYRRMQFNAELQDEVTQLQKQLAALAEQNEKLTEAYDQCGRTVQDYGRTIDQTESRLREVATHCANVEQQLAALAEQNEKMRKVLLRLACLGNGDQYGSSIGNCIAQEALSLPDLASPVLNRIRAEGMRISTEIHECEDVLAPVGNSVWGEAYQQGWIDGTAKYRDVIHARAAELEKSNG